MFGEVLVRREVKIFKVYLSLKKFKGVSFLCQMFSVILHQVDYHKARMNVVLSDRPQSVRNFTVHRYGLVYVLRLLNCFLTFKQSEVSPVGRRELDTTRISAATTLVQDVRFYRDLNSDRWIQSPEC